MSYSNKQGMHLSRFIYYGSVRILRFYASLYRITQVLNQVLLDCTFLSS
jgi:hypothetical protein